MSVPSLAPLLHPLQLTKLSPSSMQRAWLLSPENCQVLKVWDKIFPFIHSFIYSLIPSFIQQIIPNTLCARHWEPKVKQTRPDLRSLQPDSHGKCAN